MVISDPKGEPPNVTQGFRIEYHVAPTSVLGSNLKLPFTLGYRPTVAIDIWEMTNGAKVAGGRVRIITEGYATGQGYLAPTISPHGKYTGSPHPEAQGAPLVATAAYWDGKWDHGVNDGVNALARTGPIPSGNYYAAYLSLDDEPLEGSEEFVAFVKNARPWRDTDSAGRAIGTLGGPTWPSVLDSNS